MIRFRGREIDRPEKGLDLMTRVADEVGGTVEGKSSKGRDLIMMVKP